MRTLAESSQHFGVVTTSWDQVESIKTDKPLNVVLQDGKTVQGTLATSEGKVEVAVSDKKVSVPPTEIATIRDATEQRIYERLLRPGWGQVWAGAASLGLAGTSGNARTLTFTTGVNAARVTNTDKTSLYFNNIQASSFVNGRNSDTAEAIRAGVSYDHNLNPRLFVNVFNDYEYDKFQNLDLRFVAGGGFGFHAVKTERSRFDVLGGADYNHSSFSTPLTRSSAELYWGDEYTLDAGACSVRKYRSILTCMRLVLQLGFPSAETPQPGVAGELSKIGAAITVPGGIVCGCIFRQAGANC